MDTTPLPERLCWVWPKPGEASGLLRRSAAPSWWPASLGGAGHALPPAVMRRPSCWLSDCTPGSIPPLTALSRRSVSVFGLPGTAAAGRPVGRLHPWTCPLLPCQTAGTVAGSAAVPSCSVGGFILELRLRARGDLVMGEQQRATAVQAGPAAVVSCWLCGTRLSAALMVADGGPACADVRWFCRVVQRCIERWTSHPVKPAGSTPAPEPGEKAAAWLGRTASAAGVSTTPGAATAALCPSPPGAHCQNRVVAPC